MPQTYLVDAYNLMHATGIGSGRRQAIARLIARAAAWIRAQPRGGSVVLVFDGAKPPEVAATPEVAGLELRWKLDSADQDLMELLERRGSCVLVSADREVVDRASALKQGVLAPLAFWEFLETPELENRDAELTPGDVDYWLEVFGGAPRPKPPPPKHAEPVLPPDEVQRWLTYFGEGE